MATPNRVYPIIHNPAQDVNLWLDLLPRINHLSEPNAENRECIGCSADAEELGPDDPDNAGDQLIELRCGCRFHRSCLGESLTNAGDGEPEFGPDARCPLCAHMFFKSFLPQWLARLKSVDVGELEEQDRHCSLCIDEYATVQGASETANIESPRRLPCGHVFGLRCLERYYTPLPTGHNSNKCPMCRSQFFYPYPTEVDEVHEGELQGLSPADREWKIAEKGVHDFWEEERDFWVSQKDTWVRTRGDALDDRHRIINARIRELDHSKRVWDAQQRRRRG